MYMKSGQGAVQVKTAPSILIVSASPPPAQGGRLPGRPAGHTGAGDTFHGHPRIPLPARGAQIVVPPYAANGHHRDVHSAAQISLQRVIVHRRGILFGPSGKDGPTPR